MTSIAVTTELYHNGCMLFNAYDNPVGFITDETGVFYPLAELRAEDIDAAELELDFKGSNAKPAVYMEEVLIQHVIEGEVDTYDTEVEKQEDADKSARAWEEYDDADNGTSVYDAIAG
jgi:hypothetical protein